MLELKVPIAYDEQQNLISPERAQKGAAYFCPACGASLVFRQGEVKVPHFAHRLSETCNQETIIHKIAKLLVQKAVTDWKAGLAAAPILKRKCQICRSHVEQPLPDKVDTAVVETRLPNGFIADVALIVSGKPEAAIEIKVSHKVDEVKARRLSIPFLELDGVTVIEDSHSWEPTRDGFKPVTCTRCSRNVQTFQAKVAEIAQRSGVELPTSYYRYAWHVCWKCQKEIVVFTWPGQGMHAEKPPRQQPIPKTLRYEFSKTVGAKYWVNTCPYCRAIQGDFFLYSEPEGPFFGFRCGRDTPEAFRQDLMLIAAHVDYFGML